MMWISKEQKYTVGLLEVSQGFLGLVGKGNKKQSSFFIINYLYYQTRNCMDQGSALFMVSLMEKL